MKEELVRTPPMGWNSWNAFRADIDEQRIYEIADALVASGLRKSGYEYVCIDDGWMAPERDARGRLQPDPERFPNGIPVVSEYVHARGLKLGIYACAGTATCEGLPGSLDHEEEDAHLFAEWQVDYLKYDNCFHQDRDAVERYTAMQEALYHTGRPIVYSVCEWGHNRPWEWAPEIAHLWRTGPDIEDAWDSVMEILDRQVGLAGYAAPGGWNDPDMLEVGNGGMTYAEYRTHFSPIG